MGNVICELGFYRPTREIRVRRSVFVAIFLDIVNFNWKDMKILPDTWKITFNGLICGKVGCRKYKNQEPQHATVEERELSFR
jgi:hypothetical protein